MQQDAVFAIPPHQPQQHLQHQPPTPGRVRHERPVRPRRPRSPTGPAAPNAIPIGKVIQGKKLPSSTKVAALGRLLGREPQALQIPGKSRRAPRRTHHRSIPWYNFMATPRSFRTHADTYSAPMIPHEDGPPPYRIRKMPPGTPRTTFQTSRRLFSGARGRPRGTAPHSPAPPTPRPLRPDARRSGTHAPSRPDGHRRRPGAPTAVRPSADGPTGRRLRGRRPFRRPGKDR